MVQPLVAQRLEHGRTEHQAEACIGSLFSEAHRMRQVAEPRRLAHVGQQSLARLADGAALALRQDADAGAIRSRLTARGSTPRPSKAGSLTAFCCHHGRA
jgi:hypothetical protein